MIESAIEARTRRFYDWELKGRGWTTHDFPVALEPAFQPFPGHVFPTPRADDGRKPTTLSLLLDRILGLQAPIGDTEVSIGLRPPAPDQDAGWGTAAERDILVPADLRVDPATNEAWLRATGAATGRMSWELIGTGRTVALRMAMAERDEAIVQGQLQAFLPRSVAAEARQSLHELWAAAEGEAIAGLEFGLAREFVIPLASLGRGPHPLTALVGALSQVARDEMAVIQVLFEEARAPWAPHVLRAVTSPNGEPFFIDAPELTTLAEEKCSTPIYAVALRLGIRTQDEERTSTLLRNLAGALAQFGSPTRNELVPLGGDRGSGVVEDILERRTYRSGMLLSLAELSAIVRLPDETLRSSALVRTPDRVEMLPDEVTGPVGATLGLASHKGSRTPVRIRPEARMQHVYVIGASGTGKSTLLEQMILDDIASGAGVGVLDPHGDLVEDILGRIPSNRVDDVVLFDPADPKASVGWNILTAHSDIEKELLASDLVGVFRRLSTSWGDQMSVVLGNAIMAFLESSLGGSLTDLRQFLLDESYRQTFLKTVGDPHVTSFWEQEWPLLVGKRPQAPILTRLDMFLRSRLVREAVTKKENGLNFRSLVDNEKIFLAKLSQGAIGEENASLLGALLVSKFHQVSLSRQDMALDSRRPFYLFIDEFQQVVTPSMAGLFSGLRKYRLGVTVAHHDLYQLHANAPEVERAVLTNAYTRVFFRVSDDDARKLGRGIGDFTAEDLTSLGRGEAICRVEQRDQAFRLQTIPLDEVRTEDAERRRDEVRTASRERAGSKGEVLIPAGGKESSHPPPDPHPVTARQPVPVPEVAPAAPSAPGRGGPIHKYLQGLIKEWGISAGFRVEIEHELPAKERVDVALFRDDLSIACEIAGATTVEQESANLSKCVSAGFARVISVSLDARFLRKLEAAIAESFAEDFRVRITLCAPEELITILRTYERVEPELRVAGYKVKVRHQAAKESNSAARRRAIADVMLKSLKRMREKKDD